MLFALDASFRARDNCGVGYELGDDYYVPRRATTPGVSMPMAANLSKTTEMLSLWSGRYCSNTSALLLLPSLLPVLRGMYGPPS